MAFETARTHSIVPRTLVSMVREKISALMFDVIAPERLPIWEYINVSHAEHKQHTRAITYTSTINTVVDSAKFLYGSLHHVIHTSFIRDVNFHRYRPEGGVLGELLALFGSGQGACFIDVGKHHTFGSSFGKREGSFFANAAGGLTKLGQRGRVAGWMKTLAPVTSANPSNETLPAIFIQRVRISDTR